ncbi:hypothetical protein MK805_09575 [Shimazuella sp. AN120528]|uniref:hypothetical protein n=1 Tax=Shimazuella soli TaxID=1892854 RepID=UPI001F0F9B45|nr:hypothetical protein [Shimazuella soli]MCH5585217.1 hypothetical protein [Shimazuella soli]
MKKWLGALFAFVVMFAVQVNVTHAATTYWSGYAHFSTSFTTKTFYLSNKQLVLDFEKYASPKDGSFRIELRKKGSGKQVDYCIGDAYADKKGYDAQCFFDSKRSAGNYYLKFVNLTKGTTIHIPSYTLHD